MKIKDFIPPASDRPADVMGVEILYKTTESPNVYTIKTIERGRDPEWELFTSSAYNANNFGTGELDITSDMIHGTLPSNQTLRAWDNVPRKALAQEIVGNRLVYGNYLQGFNMRNPVNLVQSVKGDSYVEGDIGIAKKSIKSIRNYKLGIVFGDKYGRETPVISAIHTTGWDDNFMSQTGDINVEKKFSSLANSFYVRPTWMSPIVSSNEAGPEDWMSYLKYYIKETSSEYYNLVMDRWYKAEEEDNIWLSFPSADRNKVDEETYLILKNEHGNQTPVEEKARYKVIAIKNEAPEFIKKDKRLLGRVRLTANELFVSGSGNPNTDQPSQLVQKDSIYIVQQDWNNFLHDYKEKNTNSKLTMRFIAEDVENEVVVGSAGESDEFITLNHWQHIYIGPLLQGVILQWEMPLGAQGDLRQRIISENGSIAGDLNYYVELREEIVENKPEFEGRFFVLLEKDYVLNEAVQKSSGLSAGWVEIGSYEICYVDSQSNNPAQSGIYAGADWSDAAPGNFNVDNADYFAIGLRESNDADANALLASDNIANFAVQTQEYWDAYCTMDYNLTDSIFPPDQWGNGGLGTGARVFLDGARAVKYQRKS